MNYPIISMSDIADVVRQCQASNRGLALFGKGGSAKTSSVSTIAETLNVDSEHVYVVNTNGLGTQEVVGWGNPNLEEGTMNFLRAGKFPYYEEIGDAPAILMWDEFPENEECVMALARSLFPAVGERPMLGAHELSANTFIIFTGNRRQDGSKSRVLSAPLVSRFCCYEMQLSLDDWLEYQRSRGGGMHTTGAFTFLSLSQGLGEGDHFNPPTPQPWDGSPHPSPRTWEAVLNCLNDMPELETSSHFHRLKRMLHANVGDKASLACASFIEAVASKVKIIASIRAGIDSMPRGVSDCYQILYAGIRIAKSEGRTDPEAYTVGGSIDWLVKMMVDSPAEIRSWAYQCANDNGLHLTMHPRNKDLRDNLSF